MLHDKAKQLIPYRGKGVGGWSMYYTLTINSNFSREIDSVGKDAVVHPYLVSCFLTSFLELSPASKTRFWEKIT